MSTLSLADEYRDRARNFLGRQATVKPSETFCAMLLAKDLMAGNPAEHKAGYSTENAALAAVEIFPDADADRLRSML